MKANQDPRWRRLARLSVGLLVAAMAGQGALWAKEAVAPAFHIETITVEAERLSPEIVLAESLLQEGREYDESELREAVHRINRLPFVLLAEFSLRKGSERGRYELVIQVYEARRWFSQITLGVAADDTGDRFRAGHSGDGFLRSDSDDDFDALIGRRFAVGRRGLLFASFGSEAGLFAVGYQHYDLWDRNILFSITLGGDDQAGGRSRELRAQLGIPLRGNHGLRLLAGWNRHTWDSWTGADSQSRESEVEIAWVFNSLDDPVLPREGLLFELGLAGIRRDDRRQPIWTPEGVERRDFSERRSAVEGSVARYWPVGERQSLSAGASGFLADRTALGRKWQGQASVGHQVFLLRNQEAGNWRELRLETRLSGSREEYARDLPPPGFPPLPSTVDRVRLQTGLTYRNGWGIFRFFIEHGEEWF